MVNLHYSPMKTSRAIMTIHDLSRVLSILILLISTTCEATVSISCPNVIKEIAPCVSFLGKSSSASMPTKLCCDGIKELYGEAGNQKDRTEICLCLKQGLAKISNYDPKRVPLLPKLCGLSITLPPIDHNTDCSNAIFMM